MSKKYVVLTDRDLYKRRYWPDEEENDYLVTVQSGSIKDTEAGALARYFDVIDKEQRGIRGGGKNTQLMVMEEADVGKIFKAAVKDQ